ncbi:hypothetical protein EG68_11782 [Paragonimus skrjabini miyazakii]|uniref:Cullin N-terminal domain-containing protein n=1 Tax=Paragonimus skrjabini miyazakii TaxID=59628 RepID=A0A8S9YPM7_9TREM|nr:hypothetical protein EG68_11782 [Paragonimus skrjabini miyazakii]
MNPWVAVMIQNSASRIVCPILVFESSLGQIFSLTTIVWPLALITWREHLLKPHSRVLISAILREIDRERHGEVLSTVRLRKIIECLVELGITSDTHSHPSPSSGNQPLSEHLSGLMGATSSSRLPTTPTIGGIQPNPEWAVTAPVPTARENPHRVSSNVGSASAPLPTDCTSPGSITLSAEVGLSVYQEYFERNFLSETERCYRLESVQSLQSNTVPEYLQKVSSPTHSPMLFSRFIYPIYTFGPL